MNIRKVAIYGWSKPPSMHLGAVPGSYPSVNARTRVNITMQIQADENLKNHNAMHVSHA